MFVKRSTTSFKIKLKHGGYMKELHSQEVRKLAPENDPLKIGMGWKVEDLSKPQVMVESTYGDSHQEVHI